jgi:hypothetical protein
MATNLTVNFLGNNQLSKTTAVITRDLNKLNKRVQALGGSFNKALNGVGIGLSLAVITNGLKNATKAASEDVKAQGLLAQALQKSVGATSQAIAGAELYIKNTQLQTSVLDDELRPALATAVRATGSLAGGQRLLNAALDLSAGTGKSLSTVTGALSKAINGQTGSLKKLVPGLKLTSDVLVDVERGFAGAAETAAKLDPYKRLEVVFAEIQETIGMALLPALEEFTAYIVSPEGQKNLQELVNGFVKVGEAIVGGTKFLVDNINFVKLMVAEVLILKTTFMVLNGIIALTNAGIITATNAMKLFKTALVTSGIGALLVGAGFLVEQFIPKDAEPQPQIPAVITTDTLGPRLNTTASTIGKIKSAGKAINNALKEQVAKVQSTAETFRDAVGLAFGTFGEDENSVFNVDVVISKLRRVVQAAKGFAENLNKLRKRGADESVISEIVGMGPAQGNIVAKGLLNSGKLSEYLKLRGSLYNTGAEAGAQQAMAGNATYEINLNGTNVKATDIIREIRILEKKTGRKYLLG